MGDGARVRARLDMPYSIAEADGHGVMAEIMDPERMSRAEAAAMPD